MRLEPLTRRLYLLATRRATRGAGLVLLIAASIWIGHAQSPVQAVQIPPADSPPVAASPAIEVVFVLDTTGSMAGLLAGAKQKIWGIASDLARANQAPELRIGLIGFRDRGDAYVTQRFDLSSDIDAVYARLQGFEAAGGGDGPESVNQALHEAVHRMSWSVGSDAYRVIFLVGDAPPHMDYAQDVPFADSVRHASGKGIRVNAIQCGQHPETERTWRAIAHQSQGEYVAIAQDGAMRASATPMDAPLAALQRELATTALPWGDAAARDELRDTLRRSAAAAAPLAASRLSYLDKKGGRLTSGRGDLVDAVREDQVELEALPPESLPPEMQSLKPAERTRVVAEKARAREEIQAKISDLVRQRDAYLDAQRRDGGDGFDDHVRETIRKQAAEKGIVYSDDDSTGVLASGR